MTKAKLFPFIALLALSACGKTTGSDPKSLSSDQLNRSSCAHCKSKPFYVDGHWVQKRRAFGE